MPVDTDITTQVTQELAKQNGTIKERIVKIKVDDELEKRKTTALQALRKVETLKQTLSEIKPATVFDAEGNGKEVGFSEAQNKQRADIKDQLAKYEAALLQALGEEANWQPLTTLVK